MRLVPYLLQQVPMGMAAIALHEISHVLVGRLAGLNRWFLQVGPLLVAHDGDRIRVHLRRRFGITWFGICGAYGDNLSDTEIRRAYTWLAAGGPLGSLLIGILLLQQHGMLNYLGVFSFGIGLATLIPSKLGGPSSDGLKLMQFLRPGTAGDELAAKQALGLGTLLGVPTERLAPYMDLLQKSDNADHRKFAAIFAGRAT